MIIHRDSFEPHLITLQSGDRQVLPRRGPLVLFEALPPSDSRAASATTKGLNTLDRDKIRKLILDMQESKANRARLNMMRGIVLLNCTILLVSCHRTQKVPLEPLPDLEIIAVANPGPYSQAEIDRQVLQDLVEIHNAGMVERAWADIKSRMPEAKAEKLLAGYFMNTNVIIFRLQYQMLRGSASSNQEFSYSRHGTNWMLRWDQLPSPAAKGDPFIRDGTNQRLRWFESK